MRHHAMVIAAPGADGCPQAIAEAAIGSFLDRMPVWCVRAYQTHQGKRTPTTSGPEYEGDIFAIPRAAYTWWVKAATEWDHRNCALSIMRCENPVADRIWIVDTDEFYSDADFEELKARVEKSGAAAWYVRRRAYWKGLNWKIDPIEPAPTLFCIDPAKVPAFFWVRMPLVPNSEKQELIEGPLQHHLTAVRNDEQIRRKIAAFGHSGEVRPSWLAEVWDKWTPGMENLHPTHPSAWCRAIGAVREELPEAVQPLWEEFSYPLASIPAAT